MSIQDFSIGQFTHRFSMVHALDSRAKILISIALMIFLFAIQSIFIALIFMVIIFLLFPLSKLTPVLAIRTVRPFLWLFGLTIILHALMTPGITLWDISGSGIKISKEGLTSGFFYSIRFLTLMLIAGLFTLTTSPMDFADSIEKMLSPLRKIGLSVHEITMMMSISIRFIPILVEETARIQNAQMSRGARFNGNALQKIRNLLPVVIPLFLSSFHKANDLAMAMDARCYHGGDDRTSFQIQKMAWKDWLAIGLTFIFGWIVFLMERS